MPTIKYAKDQTMTSTTCAAIKTDTVEIITTIKNTAGCDLFSALTARSTHTSIVITNAWIAMFTALTGMVCSLRFPGSQLGAHCRRATGLSRTHDDQVDAFLSHGGKPRNE